MKNRLNSWTRSSVWLNFARLTWMLVAGLLLLVLVAAIPTRIQELRQDPFRIATSLAQLNLTIDFFAFYGTGFDVLTTLAFIIISAVIFWRKSNERMGYFTSLVLLIFPFAILPLTTALFHAQPILRFLLLLGRLFGLSLIINFFFLFPNGRFVPHWTRFVAVLSFLNVFLLLLYPELNPPTALIDFDEPSDYLASILILAWLLLGLVAQIIRYIRFSSSLERQQTKWVVIGFAGVFFGLSLAILPVFIFPALLASGTHQILFLLVVIPWVLVSILLIPLSITFSILRYHLWDIDVFINRALVYGALTATLVVFFFLVVFLLQEIFRTLTGQRQQEIVTVISTLAITSLVNPLRQRIQNDIDRRFYRKKYDAERTLLAFAASLRDEVELEQLKDDLLSIIQETMQPERVSLWLKPESDVRGFEA